MPAVDPPTRSMGDRAITIITIIIVYYAEAIYARYRTGTNGRKA